MTEPTLLTSIDELLPGEIPPAYRALHESVRHCQKAYGEMLTQVPTEYAQTLASMRDLQKAEMKLLVAILKDKLR
jgi:hypothetical protein